MSRDPASSNHLPPAVVFDCDGTLADTETLADQAWADALRPHGYEPTQEDFDAVIGKPWHRCWAYFSERAQLDDEETFRAEITAHFVERFDRELMLYDDAVDTMRRLAAAGVRIAVASSSRREAVEAVLDRAGTRRLVGAIVGQEDVTRHKPDPEPYLEAARLLGTDPTACAAVEDTTVGVTAAVAAGMFTVGILRRSTTPEQLAAAHRVVRRVTMDVFTPV